MDALLSSIIKWGQPGQQPHVLSFWRGFKSNVAAAVADCTATIGIAKASTILKSPWLCQAKSCTALPLA